MQNSRENVEHYLHKVTAGWVLPQTDVHNGVTHHNIHRILQAQRSIFGKKWVWIFFKCLSFFLSKYCSLPLEWHRRRYLTGAGTASCAGSHWRQCSRRTGPAGCSRCSWAAPGTHYHHHYHYHLSRQSLSAEPVARISLLLESSTALSWVCGPTNVLSW